MKLYAVEIISATLIAHNFYNVAVILTYSNISRDSFQTIGNLTFHMTAQEYDCLRKKGKVLFDETSQQYKLID